MALNLIPTVNIGNQVAGHSADQDLAEAKKLVSWVLNCAANVSACRWQWNYRYDCSVNPHDLSDERLSGEMGQAEEEFEASLANALANPISEQLLPADRDVEALAEVHDPYSTFLPEGYETW